jgi:hypothetical protein
VSPRFRADFPDGSTGDDSDAVPELIIDYRRGYHQ